MLVLDQGRTINIYNKERFTNHFDHEEATLQATRNRARRWPRRTTLKPQTAQERPQGRAPGPRGRYILRILEHFLDRKSFKIWRCSMERWTLLTARNDEVTRRKSLSRRRNCSNDLSYVNLDWTTREGGGGGDREDLNDAT